MAHNTVKSLAGVAAAAGLAALSLAGASAASASTSPAAVGSVLSRSAAGTVSWRTPAARAGATSLASTADPSPGGAPGAATVITLASPSAPSRYAFPLSLPAGSAAALQPDGSLLITRAGQPLGSFRPPWARDATGRALPTHYTLAGRARTGYVLTQHVATPGAAFPVTADPHYTWGWVTGTIYFNKVETKKFAVGVGIAAFIATFTGPWAPLVRGYVAVIGAVAGWAIADGKCVDFKSTGTAHEYGGSQGDGYCR